MAVRTCDRCGIGMSPRWPRTRVASGELWCPSCVASQGHVHSTAAVEDERHPDLLESQRLFGSVHTTGGRVLHRLRTASTYDEQEKRLSNQSLWTNKVGFRPVRHAIEGARAYATKVGLGDPHAQSFEHVMQDPHTIRSVGRAYDALPDNDPSAHTHFDAMRKEVGQQYHHLTHTMGIHVASVDHDPYDDVHAMVHDVEHNKRLLVMGTHVTGGHPHFTDHENDQFRAVHDFFGHAATGRSFDRHGEEAAFRAHAGMFSEHARPALASETRGQNASLILNGDFGPQKVGIMRPEHYNPPHTAVLMARYAAGWSGEDVIRHELGRQKVHDVYVNGEHVGQMCPQHLDAQRQRSDLQGGLGRQLSMDNRYATIQHGPIREGKCATCATVGGAQSLTEPWNLRATPGTPAQRSDVAVPRHNEGDDWGNGYQQGRWPSRPAMPHERFGPVDTTIRSLNMRVAVALPGQRVQGIRVQAHDSGDGETIFHCPFCGSGQVIARSDGTVECEFCSTAFTVQVQPQMPAFPQTIDGVPVEVPGMPAGGVNANVPPGTAPGASPGADGPPGANDGGFPPGDDAAGPGDEEDDEDEDSDDDKPAFLKGSLLLRTDTGAVLREDQYMRRLALHHLPDRDAVLARVRDENGAR